MFSKLDVNSFFPVQHQLTDAYFAFNVLENIDYDLATDVDKFLCYPVNEEGILDLQSKYIFLKGDIRPIPLLL